MTKDQENHIKAFGPQRFNRLLIAAAVATRGDTRLLGAKTIRAEIAEHAALEASGYPCKALILSKKCGALTHNVQQIALEICAKALEAAREAAK